MNFLNLTINSGNYDVVQNMNILTINGSQNNIRIKSHIINLIIIGFKNQIDGNDQTV